MSVRLKKQYFILLALLLVSCLGTSNETSIPEKLIPTQTKRETASQPPSCRSITIAPTPASEESSIFPDISEDDHIQGPNNADITIIEYGDFQCPRCAELASIMTQLEESYPAEFRFVFRQLPLFDIHDKALIAAEASEAANADGKFWEMYHLLFEEKNDWVDLTPEEFSKW